MLAAPQYFEMRAPSMRWCAAGDVRQRRPSDVRWGEHDVAELTLGSMTTRTSSVDSSRKLSTSGSFLSL
jgi:hypothetical protein